MCGAKTVLTTALIHNSVMGMKHLRILYFKYFSLDATEFYRLYLKEPTTVVTFISIYLFPACMRSNPSLMDSKGRVWVTNSSTFIFLVM